MSGYEVSARERAVWSLRTEVRHTARDVFGAALTETPIAGMTVATPSGLDEPLAGVRAAVLARDVAAGQVRVYAEAARGAGRSWDEVGEALGIDADEYGEPRAELAFLLLIEGRPLPDSAPSFGSGRSAARWTCTACGQRITDTGPFEAAPFNNEDGHAGDCPRHAAEIAACRATWGDG
jgi:hypothetical protein